MKIPRIRQKKSPSAPPTPPPGGGVAALTTASWQTQLFWQAVKRSAIAHGALFVAMLLSWLVFPSSPIVVMPSIRVDLVGLPDIAKKDLQKFKPSDFKDLSEKLDDAKESSKKTLKQVQKETEAPEPDDTMAMKKEKPGHSKKDLKSAIERIKALEAIEDDVKKSSKRVQAKGNILNKGTDLVGETGQSMEGYADKMRSRLRDNWDLPVWLSQQSLSAKVLVFLDASGRVIHMVFRKSSGNDQFDRYVKSTIERSAPFDPPPKEILNGGVTLGFPL